ASHTLVCSMGLPVAILRVGGMLIAKPVRSAEAERCLAGRRRHVLQQHSGRVGGRRQYVRIHYRVCIFEVVIERSQKTAVWRMKNRSGNVTFVDLSLFKWLVRCKLILRVQRGI